VPDPAPPPVADVKAFDRYGERITLPAADVPKLVEMGGRVATGEEIAASIAAANEDAARQRAVARDAGVSFADDLALMGAGAVGMRTTGRLLGPEGRTAIRSYMLGVNQGLTVGLGPAVTKEAIGAVAGSDAAKAYAGQIDDLREAHRGLVLGGEIAGMYAGSKMGGSAGIVGKLSPVAAIERAGASAAARVAPRLAGLAERGIAGSVLAGAGEMAARGATEGALYGAAQAVSEDLIHDKDLTAERIFAATGLGALAGGVLGGGLGAAGGAVRGGVREARPAVERALTDAAESIVARGRAVTEEGAAGVVRREASGGLGELSRALGDIGDNEGRKAAADQAWRALDSAKKYAAQADKYLARDGGTRAVGRVLLERGIIDAGAREAGESTASAVVRAMRHGTPADLAPKIGAELEAVGAKIGEITSGSEARVTSAEIDRAFAPVLAEHGKIAGFEHVVEAVRGYRASLFEHLGVSAPGERMIKGQKLGASVQDLLEQRKGLDRLIYQEQQTLDPKGRLAALRDVRRGLEDLIVEAIDKSAAEMIPGRAGVGAELKALKRDYQALRIAQDAAEDAATRSSRNRILSLTDTIAAGGAIAAGHPLAAPVVGLGHTIVRQRGNAGAAVLLSRLADHGTISEISSRVADWTERAARGVISPSGTATGVPRSARGQPGSIVSRAQQIVMAVRRMQGDPQAFQDRLRRESESLGRFAPQTSLAYTAVAVKAANALAASLPVTPSVDPLDARSPPRLTPDQAAQVVELAGYVDHPEHLFRDLEDGRISPSGMAMARSIMPRTVAQLEDAAYAEVARRKAQGQPVDFAQRTRLTLLSGRPFDPLYQPSYLRALQASTAPAPVEPADKLSPEKPHKPVTMPKSMQGSTLDRVSSR
jgi:hypothetical protein